MSSDYPASSSNENRFDSSSNNPTHAQFHQRRPPLDTIPDPSQLRHGLESDSDAPKLDGADGSHAFDDKTSVSSSEGLLAVKKYVSVGGLCTTTPKVTSRRSRVNTESNSARTTPSRSCGSRGLGAGGKVYQSTGGRASSTVSRRFTIVNTEQPEKLVDAPHFELEEHPLFWKDHNVQVLIRVRPLNNVERVMQGNARCLKQENAHAFFWLGHPETRFTFDHIVCETITQEKLFRVAGLPMVENCMSGYNSCIFAYGQTGSGKTYTMMGEIHMNKGKLDQDCGITPRIFEFLFTKIKAEEERRTDEKLTYNCKCSFLEIYNEQITDLLEPSSNNLQLREDFKKGVYVENLTEHNVRTVSDVLQLLLKGSANRKNAATHMNSESSRSHSVFTCIIESRWEKDSMVHSRYGRLNLVDLAGSERQKSSGAEGDRLKEAANINKSLSTLGLVIMSLVDVAQGKQRHVPYRDSRLTFLLQDSLGGNSKTTIIANVSPSFCSASETLSTLKFAQRAKLIQNNAKVNEEASGDVTALQEQVQRLKDQLSNLLHIQGQPAEQFQKIAHSAIKKLEVRHENNIKLEDEAHHSTTKLLLEEGDTITIRGDFGYNTYSNLKEVENGLEKNHDNSNILIDASECEHVRLMEELQLTKERNKQLLYIMETGSMKLVSEDSRSLVLQYEVEKLNRELEEARLCNKQYEDAEALKLHRQKDVEIVCEQVELETASTIIHLQEEIAMLQVELDKRSSSMRAENSNLQNAIRDKDDQLKEMSVQMIQWEKATLELTSFLMDGSKSMNIASSHIKSISRLFPCVNGSLRESIELAAQEFIKKEELILLLQKSLEEAQKTVFETEVHLDSLKRVSIAFNEAQNLVSTGCSGKLKKVADKVCKEPETISSELKRLSHTSSLEHEAQANELAMGGGKVLTDLTRLKRQKSDEEHLKANDYQMMNCIREDIAETNSRLGLIQASVSKLLETYADQWESDSSTSDSSMSLTNTSASEKRPRFVSASEPLHEVDGSMLIEELELASRGFINLSVSLISLVTHTDLTIKPHGYAVNNTLSGDASVNIIHRISDLSCLPQSSNAGTQGDHLDFNKSIPPDGKVEQSTGFISSFQEACATMQEAGLMLNELVKSNVNANQLTHIWKQVGKNLKGERDCLFDQVQQLQSKLHASKAENTLDNEISDLIRVTKSVSSLLDFFEDMPKGLEELFTGVLSDILSVSKDIKSFVGSLWEFFEQICAELMENNFSSLIVCMCISDSLDSIQGLFVHRAQASHEIEANSNTVSCGGTLSRDQYDKIAALPMLEIEESYPHLGGLSQENLQLKRELQRKEVVLKGLLFDFSLLQEAASNRKDIKDEINKLIVALGQAEFELHVKRQDVNSLLLQIREMEGTLTETKQALAISNTELEKTQRSVGLLSNDNNELRILVDDLHSRKLVAEKQLDEQDEAIKGLEKEILHLTSSASEKVLLSIENVEHECLRVTAERDQLRDEIRSLTEEVEMAYSLAGENEALALEAHQDSVANKIYAEQKEEEVKILESSIKELEDTVNVLEKKVQETDEEVQKHRLDRNSLETEIQALRQRMLTVEYLAENMDPEDTTNEKPDSHILRRFGNQGLDLDQACTQIKALKKIRAEQAKEISRMKEYISELVLFAEAQASLYQDKYKALEAMICELKKKPTSTVSVAPVMERSEGSSSRSRGSNSPFRCISNLVHQMNVEKDHDLSTAKSRVEDLELLVASKQNEVCMLSSRLAAAESMTHDVIRDLLGLKLDMTNYADLVDENQLYSLLDVAQKKTMESERKEEEIHRLRMQIRDLIDERDRCITEINRKESNVIAAQMTLEQLKERDHYLTVQNEMLKVEKSNLMNRLVEVESRGNQQDHLGPVPSRRRR